MWAMKFVDRIDEATRLKDALAREKSSLVVMYGRRRLGKSTLIKRVLSVSRKAKYAMVAILMILLLLI